jgi:hypothetical protein
MSHLLRVTFAVMVALACISTSAWAAPITAYSNRADWASASGATESLDFEGAVGSGSEYLGPAEDFGSIQFIIRPVKSGAVYLTFPDYPTDAPFYTSNYLHLQQDRNFPVGFNIDRFIRFDRRFTTSFAADFGTFFGRPTDLSLTFLFADGTTATEAVSLGGGAQSFLGFVSDTPFRQILLESSDSFLTLDNVGYNSVFPVPEPGTALLVASGIAALAARMRRRRSAAESQL